MIKRLLIANRGEIACRIVRTARRLGIHTVAVYSEADAGARHVREADEAWLLGSPPARESYLAIPRLLEIAQRAGVDAIHPGYGFLSENAAFARACTAAGIHFVGPPAAALEAMGSKGGARDLMRRAGVPVLPGYDGAAQDLATLAREGRALGLPLIVKPGAGGGGKGMQIVDSEAELSTALASARRLAESAFGNGDLVLERYLRAPRHVEVQVLADMHGRCVHVYDRDCSVQRRHQKLIEEAPAPGIPDEVRARLHAAAVTAATSVAYVSAGTVEFLYEAGQFWFMEMNTRLQVEHPVTEMITGLDLVEWQLRIAAGEPLTWSPDATGPRGHAIEVRVCAEDPEQDFAPSSGTLIRADWPAAREGIRVDAGFATGDTVPAWYDSLLAKVIAHGDTRATALQRLEAALDDVRIAGVRSTERWLREALAHPAIATATPTTRFLVDHGQDLEVKTDLPLAAALAALCCALGDRACGDDPSPWARVDAFRVGLPAAQRRSFDSAGERLDVHLESQGDDWRARVGEREFLLRPRGAGVSVDGHYLPFEATLSGRELTLWWPGSRCVLQVHDPRDVSFTASATAGALTTPLPGTVVQVLVKEGDVVAIGQPLLVVEAMKMEHTIAAPRAGHVTAIRFAAGERVPEGAVLIELGD
jgi:3-methylcrotonyl-CoA carboxylase alpha subunit